MSFFRRDGILVKVFQKSLRHIGIVSFIVLGFFLLVCSGSMVADAWYTPSLPNPFAGSQISASEFFLPVDVAIPGDSDLIKTFKEDNNDFLENELRITKYPEVG
jgi:hypothetical protein